MLRCEKPREACSHRGRSNDDNQVIPEILLCLFLISAFGIGSTHYWRLSRYRSLQLNERKTLAGFLRRGPIIYTAGLLFFAAAHAATIFAFAATGFRRRPCRCRANQCCEAKNQKKIFHTILLLKFCCKPRPRDKNRVPSRCVV